MKTDISNKNICFDLNRTRIASPLSQNSISITEPIQNVILKTSNQLKAGNIKEVENILQAHDFIKKLVINSNEVITACKDGLVKCLSNGRMFNAEEIVSFMKEQGIIEEKITELFNSEVNYKEKVVTACTDGLVKRLSDGWTDKTERIVSFMKEQGIIEEKITELFNSEVNYKEKIVTACMDRLVKCLRNDWTDDAERIVSFMKEQGINEEEIINKLEIIKVLMQKLNCKSIEDLFEYDCEFLSYVINNNINEFSFPDNIISNNLIKKCGLYAIYKEFNERGNFDFYIDKKQLYKILKKHDKRWQDEINISKPFDEGAKEFGIDNMFIYLSGRNVNLHDALYNFNKICKLFKKSKIDNNAFFNNI
ncbi:MAG: hypothetical protein PUH01_04215, partial [Pseudomonadota bacterium]|nr:hypothetical protein [Pseudomonadota bacterium]